MVGNDGFLPDGRYTFPILVDVWRPYEGRMVASGTETKWNIGGTVSDTGTEIHHDEQARIGPTGIYLDDLVRHFFHVRPVLPHRDIASFSAVLGLRIAKNRPGQIAILLSPAVWGEGYGGAQEFDVGSALIIATPASAASSPKEPPPTLLELANLSNNVYEGNKGHDRFKWVGNNCTVPPNTCTDFGLAAGAYATNDGSQIVIAIRGTVFTPRSRDEQIEMLSNIASDVSAFSSLNTSLNLRTAVTDAADFIRAIQARYPRGKITLTGHSLGGAIAQVEGRASGLPAIVFNAPGAGRIYNGIKQYAGHFRSSGDGPSQNYRLYGDQMSLFGQPIGTATTLQGTAGDDFGCAPGRNVLARAVPRQR